MADIKCPMCGKSNPEGSETCQHCQARIRPVFSDSFESSGDDSSLDWLNELSGAGKQQEKSSSPADDEKQQAQDWLSQIRQSPDSDTPVRSSEEGSETSEASADDLSGWMQGLMDAEEPASAAPSGGGNDWLNRFSSSPEAAEPSAEEQESPVSSTQAQDENDDDWLANLQSWQPEEEPGWEEEKPVDSWLSGLEEESSSQQEPPLEEQEQEYRSPSAGAEDEGDVPSWLQFLEEEIPEDQAPQTPQVQMPDEDSAFSEEDLLPLQEDKADLPQDEEEEGDLEIWLRSLDVDPQSFETVPSSGEPVEPLSESSDSGAERMDFSAFRLEGDSDQTEPESSPTEDGQKPSDDLPEWLTSGFKEETGEEKPEEMPDWLRSSTQAENISPDQPEEDLPEWLGTSFAAEENREPDDSAEMELPQWLGQSDSEEEQTPQTSLPPFNTDDNNLPDWLQDGGKPQQIGQPLDAEQEPVTPFDLDERETSQWMGEESRTESPFDDLEKDDSYADVFLDKNAFEETIGQRAGDTEEAQGDSQEFPPFVGEDLGEWFKDLGQIDVPEGEEAQETLLQKAEAGSESAIFADQEFDSLLSDAGLDEEKFHNGTAAADESSAGELEEVDLPAWLKAMRPIEAIAGESLDPLDERKVESAGPLAGLRSILPAEEIILHYQKPPVYSMKLQVSDKQRAHAGLLERMIEPSRAKPSAAGKESGVSTRVLRLVVGIVLLLAVLVPSFLPLHAPQPTSTAEAVQAFYSQVESLPEGQTVLLAADFEDAYYGEMRLAAENVILHLSAKNARLAVVSTLPSGPILGEALVNDVLKNYPQFYQQYQQPDWIKNLGYLAGGLASLQEFSNTPRQAVQFGMQAGLTNEYVWGSSTLKDIYSISDFGLVVLITDRVETGRAWVEQVQPVLGDTPFLLVTSAQAAPLLNAYYQADQFDGLLAGYQDGMSYPLRPQGSGVDFLSWDSFYYGMLAAVILLFAGILVNSVFSLFRRETREEAQS